MSLESELNPIYHSTLQHVYGLVVCVALQGHGSRIHIQSFCFRVRRAFLLCFLYFQVAAGKQGDELTGYKRWCSFAGGFLFNVKLEGGGGL